MRSAVKGEQLIGQLNKQIHKTEVALRSQDSYGSQSESTNNYLRNGAT